MTHSQLPQDIGVAAFDALHDDPLAWRGVMEELAAAQGSGPVRLMSEGTVLVALLGATQVLKLYPPFLRDHFEFECATLVRIGGRLSVPTPVLLDQGEHQGWPWLLMTQLHGDPLTAHWAEMAEPQRCKLLNALGALAAEVHALPPGDLAAHAPPWSAFLAGQRGRCQARQRRTGLPPHLLGQLDGFLQGALPEGPPVILTGEYTPMNLLVRSALLTGMYDFGDGLVGPREYDWLGPLSFLAAGHADRCQAFFEGYGAVPDGQQRIALMRLLLLHRYSNLQAQIACPGWQQAASFEALTARIWP